MSPTGDELRGVRQSAARLRDPKADTRGSLVVARESSAIQATLYGYAFASSKVYLRARKPAAYT